MNSASKEQITVHGSQWKRADLIDAIEFCKRLTWKEAVWKPRDALVHKRGGVTSVYIGQRFDPAKIDLVKGGWNHDHCEICWWTLHETDEADRGTGYTDGGRWLCRECYEQFIKSHVEHIG